MHKLSISIINEMLQTTQQGTTQHATPSLHDPDPKLFMEKMLARFSEIVQMGYSAPRLVQAFCDHVTLKGHFHRFFQLYIYRFICHYYTTTNRLNKRRFIQLQGNKQWYEAALQDFAGFLADRILLRCMYLVHSDRLVGWEILVANYFDSYCVVCKLFEAGRLRECIWVAT